MSVFLTIIFLLLLAALLLASAMRPPSVPLSEFELRRRSQTGDKKAESTLQQLHHQPHITTLLHVISTLLLVVVILIAVAHWGWVLGVVIGTALVLFYKGAARLPFVVTAADRLYQRINPWLLAAAVKGERVLSFLSDSMPTPEVMKVGSKEELLQVAKTSGGVLTADERRLLENGLSYGDRLVSEVMTPRSMIDSVEHDELLGPLTLDSLYKTGHSRLPVTEGDLDHVVGVLHIQNLLVVSSKKTPTAKQAMEPRVFYIREDQTLQHALSAFLKVHHHLFIVVNEYRETVGVISLEDVIEALLGRKINDEFDAHDDLRVVAARNPRANNSPDGHTDV